MLATAAKATRTSPAAKQKALLPARSFANQTRPAGATFARVGAKQPRTERQRFTLPKGFRRAAANQFSPVPLFAPPQETYRAVDTVISGARFLEALDSLPQSAAVF